MLKRAYLSEGPVSLAYAYNGPIIFQSLKLRITTQKRLALKRLLK